MPGPRKRIIIKKPGGYSRLQLDETPIGDPGADEVQVEVNACGINFADISVRLGLYAAAKDMYPICPGLEFSGIVKTVGENVKSVAPGERVFGVSRFGAYATAINCPPEHIWRLPENWDFQRGAAFPVAYLTAYYGLHKVGHLDQSDSVLVHSAAGGVGTAIIHLLKINRNMSVGIVGSTEKTSAVKEAGATFVIDKATEDLWPRAEEISREGFDVILDANGASTLHDSYLHLKPTGRLLIYGFASMFSHSGKKNYLKLIYYYFRTPRFNPFELTGSNKTISGFNLIYLFDKAEQFREIMEILLKWNSEGMLPPMPITAFPFTDVAKAHRAIESGRSIGKLILVT